MGADCCGGSAPEAPDQHSAVFPGFISAKGAKQNGTSRTHGQAAADLKAYVDRRVGLFETYRKRNDERVARAREAGVPICITLPDGAEVEGVKGVTTPMDVVKGLPKAVQKEESYFELLLFYWEDACIILNAVVAKVDGREWDLLRPLEGECALQLLGFDSADGKDCFWHSSSHVLGEALEDLFGVHLTIGPAIDEGFYYDCYMEDRVLTEADKPAIEKKIAQIVKEKQSFQRVEVTREEALDMFEENKFKVEIISKLAPGTTITLYRCGPMVDLCTGPHLPNTGYLKTNTISNLSRAFWRADATKDPLQRVYGVTFPTVEAMKDYKHRMEEAKKRDHRVLGRQLELFFFDPLSPGSCFFLPNGARVYNNLVQYIREKYWEYEYEEVVTPNIYNFDLWKQSGHADHYAENMFRFDIEKQNFGLKPMNCPGHCLMFKHRTRSYRELPMRLADFGVLHRNEYSGALTGLTRVRRFQQDDAHIFCRPDQVSAEVGAVLRMLDDVYAVFGLEYTACLSTRPDSFLGTVDMWDRAEAALSEALDRSGRKWEMNEGDGAFYGPKIDITVYDALRRKYQCATVQLDFNLPIRFNLQYVTDAQGSEGYERPVIVHRAVLGSVERMLAILTEHYAGKWPLWLSPRQVMIVPISQNSNEYAEEVKAHIRSKMLHVEVDNTDNKMEKKVREAQLKQFNYILVVGEKEKAEQTVNVRTRSNQVLGMRKLVDVIETLVRERESRSLVSCFSKPAAKPADEKPAAVSS